MSLTWTGSKRWLLKSLKPMDEVFEPFAGSAAVSFGRSTTCHLNDVVQPLIEVYRELRSDKEGLIKKVEDVVDTVRKSSRPEESYYLLRERFNVGGMMDPVLFVAILTLGFNGLYRQSANGCNVPYGGPKRVFRPEKLRSIPAEKIQTLTSERWGPHLVPNETCVVYVDPPYATTFTGYNPRGWDQSDNDSLIEVLAGLPNPVVLSLLNTEENTRKLSEFEFDYISVPKKYTNGGVLVSRKELLAFNEAGLPYVNFKGFKR